MAEIRVTSAELRGKADMLTSLNDQFKGVVEDLVNCEGTLVSMWEGDAKTTFHNEFNKDKAQWDKFYALIKTYVEALRSDAEEYDRREKENEQIAGKRNYR